MSELSKLPPSSLTWRTMRTGVVFWFLAHLALVVIPLAMGQPVSPIPHPFASVFLVLLVAVALRLDIGRSKETHLLKNLGVRPWSLALLGLVPTAVLETIVIVVGLTVAG